MRLPTIRQTGLTVFLLLFLWIMLRGYYQEFINLDKMPKPYMYKDEWLVAGSGISILPMQTQIAAKLIDSAKVTTYKTVGQFRKSGDAYVEATLFQTAWPARPDTTSRNIVGFYQDLITLPGIKIIYTYEGICIGRY